MGSEELSYAVRPTALAVVLGQFSAVLAGLTIVPAIVALGFGDVDFAASCGVIVLVLAGAAAVTRRLPQPHELQANEALVASVLLFLLSPALMTFPLASAGLDPIDAFFEAMSAVTTTGLSTVADIDGRGAAFIFARSWMQWYGGLGFVVLSIALIVRPGPLARQLAAAGNDESGFLGSARAHGRSILLVYLVLTAVGIVAVLATGVGFFPALVHVLSSVSTGGFSSRPDSLATIGGWPTQLVVLLVCCAAAVPLATYHRATRSGWRAIVADPQARALAVASAILAAAMTGILVVSDGMAPGEALRHGAFQVLSAQSTTGFATLGIGGLSDGAKVVIILAMFVGGGAGSTAGGIKLLRALAAIQVVRGLVAAASLPRHAVVRPRLGSAAIEADEAGPLLAIVVLFVAVVALSWLAFVVAGFPPLDSLLEVVSATATVGLSTGITSATLPQVLKAVLCLDMLLGRLEIVAVLVALYPRTWIGLRRKL